MASMPLGQENLQQGGAQYDGLQYAPAGVYGKGFSPQFRVFIIPSLAWFPIAGRLVVHELPMPAVTLSLQSATLVLLLSSSRLLLT